MTPAPTPPSPSGPSPREEAKQILDYLKGDGHRLVEMSEEVRDLSAQLDRALRDGTCKQLRKHWDDKYSDVYQLILGKNSRLFDDQLPDLFVTQLDWISSAMDYCDEGNQKDAHAAARGAMEYTKKIEKRMRELESEL